MTYSTGPNVFYFYYKRHTLPCFRNETKRHFIMCQQYFHSLASHRIIAKTSFLFNKGTMKKQSHC